MDSVANVHSPHFVDGELSEGLPSLTRIILKELDEKTISSKRIPKAEAIAGE